MAKIIKLATILAIICAISAGSLAYVYLFTKPQIELNAKVTLANSQREVLGSSEGLAVPVAPYGYSGTIDLLVGIDKTGKVIGLKVLSQKETPGLGANVVKQNFLRQFVGKTQNDQLVPKEDIEAITGATITTKAICQGVKQALEQKQ